MKSLPVILFFISALALTLCNISCKQQNDNSTSLRFGPKVVEANGYVVPADSMAPPKVTVVDESKLVKVPVGKPKVVQTNKNIHPAGKPKVVIAGTPRICTPGQDTFLLPKIIPAIDSPFVAGIPEVVIAKEAYAIIQNTKNLSYFGKLHGLKREHVLYLIQDDAGNLWFGIGGGGGGGVTRYDGATFTHFTEAECFAGQWIYSILEDHAGNLWFGTSGGGVSKYDGTSFTRFTTTEGLSNNTVFHIEEDHTGNLWFGTAGGGVSKYDGTSFTHFTTAEGLSHNTVIYILEDHAGNLWFGTGGGVSKYDGTSFTHLTENEGLSSNFVLSILEDHDGNLWFGTGGGVSKYDGTTFTHFTTTEGLSNNTVFQIEEDRAGNLWFGTGGGGVSKYDGTTFTHFTETEGLSSNQVASVLEDHAGNLWFGTRTGGVSKYAANSFNHFTEADGLSGNSVFSILEDYSGNLWFGTQGGGVNKYDGSSLTHFTKTDGFSNNVVRCILEDRVGNLWFGTSGGGVIRFDGSSFTHFTKTEGLSLNLVSSMLEDHAGNLWFGTQGGGVSKYDGSSFTHFTETEGLSGNFVRCMLEDHVGNIWFGTNFGVSRYDGSTFTHFTETEGLSRNWVWSMLEDNAGNLWFGTEAGGVNRYNGSTFTHFTETEGLSNNSITSMLEDHAGNLWFGTEAGLSKLSRIKLDEITYQVKSKGAREQKVLFTNYTYEDGLLGIGCYENALYEDRNGTIWIGTTDRLTALHPAKEKEIRDTSRPNIKLTGLALFNEFISWQSFHHHQDTTFTLGNGIKISNFSFDSLSRWYGLPEYLSLAFDNNSLTFSFTGITMNQPEKVKYQYKLEGNDENWSTLSLRNEASYSNLPHGSYTFKVKAMSSAGNWSDEFHYPFRIRPPWWLTWWAYSLYGFIFLTLALRLHKYQQARILRNERERTQAKELEQAKEIEKAYVELKATQKQLIQSEKMASLGELTAGIAHEIQNPLNFVNNFSEVNRELLVEMNEEIEKGNYGEVKTLAKDVTENEEKIILHGKRADAIVKGMLQHSRTSSGVKEPTDINALCDEYLRLAYHGLRAKDKSFSATMKTDLDPTIGLINVVPQDIGRVILNLITNAFYAVNEKQNKLSKNPYPLTGGAEYIPTVSISTKTISHSHPHPDTHRIGGRGFDGSGDSGFNMTHGFIEISVSDNGLGIPDSIKDKIFQPFFTTKPTGQGTGLGLSLSYDIIIAHGGEFKVNSKEGEGAEFIVRLPLPQTSKVL